MAEQPKAPMRSYFLYLEERKAEFVKKAGGNYKQGISQAAQAWKSLSAKDKLPFETKAQKLKAQYEKDMAAFLEAGGVKKGKVFKKDKLAKRKKKDANAPKKPVGGAYGCFLAANRAAITKSLPADHKVFDVTKKAGAMWKELPAGEKKKYESEFAKKNEEYKAAMEEYKKNKPDDDGDEGDEDEDEEEEDDEEEEQPAQKKAKCAGA
mmetsp:Transcript_17577/g.33133  ORF Transcript_17577/g.33133 Transcript_17577/m.33133 type:complete len:208 (+) Transcript_17577:80-703(+)